jgi:hypothetical protein
MRYCVLGRKYHEGSRAQIDAPEDTTTELIIQCHKVVVLGARPIKPLCLLGDARASCFSGSPSAQSDSPVKPKYFGINFEVGGVGAAKAASRCISYHHWRLSKAIFLLHPHKKLWALEDAHPCLSWTPRWSNHAGS